MARLRSRSRCRRSSASRSRSRPSPCPEPRRRPRSRRSPTRTQVCQSHPIPARSGMWRTRSLRSAGSRATCASIVVSYFLSIQSAQKTASTDAPAFERGRWEPVDPLGESTPSVAVGSGIDAARVAQARSGALPARQVSPRSPAQYLARAWSVVTSHRLVCLQKADPMTILLAYRWRPDADRMERQLC